MNCYNHRGGIALVKATWASWLQYRGFFFVLAFGWMVGPLIALFLWSAAAEGGELGGMTQGGFAAYYLVLILVNQLTYSQTNWTMGDLVRTGGISTWMLRPIPPLYNVLSSELAGKLVYTVFTVPVAGLLALLLKPELHTNLANVLLFFLTLGLAWALRFFWGLWLAELAFWATRSDALLVVQDSLVFLFSGLVAPVWLLPGALLSVAEILPFRYMVSFPVEVLMGQVAPDALLRGLLIQCAWTAFSVPLSWWMWRQGVRRYTAVGG